MAKCLAASCLLLCTILVTEKACKHTHLSTTVLLPLTDMTHDIPARNKPQSRADWGLWLSKSAFFLVAAALLVLLGASWSQQTAGAPVAYRLNHQVNCGCGEIATSGASLEAAAARKKTASIVVVVTSKASSWERRTWLRDQFHKNVELLRKEDPAAADGVVLRFAVGNIGGCRLANLQCQGVLLQ